MPFIQHGLLFKQVWHQMLTKKFLNFFHNFLNFTKYNLQTILAVIDEIDISAIFDVKFFLLSKYQVIHCVKEILYLVSQYLGLFISFSNFLELG